MNTRGPNSNFSVAVLGPGAIGGLLAAVLCKKGFPVTCIVRPDKIEVLNKKGFHVQSKVFGDFVARPRMVSKLDFHPDILFITTKANALLESLNSVPAAFLRKSVVIPLLNGIEHIKILREHADKRVAVGMIGRIESKKIGTDLIAHATSFTPQVEIASDNDISAGTLKKIAGILTEAGMETVVLNSEAEVVWRKLARLNAIACVTAATNHPLGFVRKNKEWQEKLKECVKEGVAVAQAEGVNLDPQEVMEEIHALPEGLTTSLQRDIANGLESELEAIPGAVLRRARQHGLPCPTIAGIYQALVGRISSEC